MNAIDLIRHIDGGRIAEDLHRKLSELQMAVCETNLKGSVTLKITVEPGNLEQSATRCHFHADVKGSIPMPPRGGIDLYIYEGEASLRHPKQPQRQTVPDNADELA